MSQDKKALIVHGGWDGHEPEACAHIAAEDLRTEAFEVTMSDTLDAYDDRAALESNDLIVQCWTMGEITPEREANLTAAVAEGVGLAGWHGGLCDAFRGATNYQWMTGGQWVAHPDGITDYTVEITAHQDPIVAGLEDFTMHSEQYYLHVDAGNEVLATTTFKRPQMRWIDGTVVPQVWKRKWGEGRVFYSALGHVAADFDVPQVREIMRRGMLWATR